MFEEQTRYQDDNTAFSVMVRVGIVTAVDNEKRLAKVYFQDMKLPSDWIPVLINRDVINDYPYDETQWTEFETESLGARVGDQDYVDHRHKLIILPWMPKVNDQVLCLYEPVRDGRGYVLGGIQPWQ